MERFHGGGMHGMRGERTPLLNRNCLRRNDDQGDLELGDAVPAANVSYVRVLALAKPESGRLIIGTITLLIASTSSILIPRFGGTIIDIVSGDLQTPEQKCEAVSKVNRTILGIFLIVIIGYRHLLFSVPSAQHFEHGYFLLQVKESLLHCERTCSHTSSIKYISLLLSKKMYFSSFFDIFYRDRRK
ncbi:putative Type I protein exporter [Helianthus annuus]|nr:putative Type I protein exporter [Helianthus annuus]